MDELNKLAELLQARADDAYCEYIDQCRSDKCLGWEIKVEHGKFGIGELHAHKEAAITLGRNRALHEAAELVRELARSNVEVRGATQLYRGASPGLPGSAPSTNEERQTP